MTNEQKNSFLVEKVLEECWHISPIGGPSCMCIKCETNDGYNPDFYTSDPDQQAINFFRLWRAIIKLGWLYPMGSQGYLKMGLIGGQPTIPLQLISCSALADAVGDYFEWKEVK